MVKTLQVWRLIVRQRRLRNYFPLGLYTDGSVTPLIEESDDNVTYTAVADADLTNTEASAALTAAGVSSIGYVGFKRYVRATAVTAASSTLSVGASYVKFGLCF